jgi:uncharacterized membrane protein YjfL (UPF0719 family)
MSSIFTQYLITFGWALTGAISMGIALGLAITIFDWITPIDEWGEIENGNMSMAVVISSIVLSTGLVIALIVMA